MIYFLFSPDSFDNFREYVIVFVKDIPLEIGEFLASELTVAENLISTSQDEASIFDMLDNIIGLLLTTDIHGKILGMIFSTASGFLMAIIMYYAIFIFFKTVVLALIQYLVIIMLISLSLILAPFFIIFSLYGTTRPLFDSWLSFLIGNSFNLILFAVTVGFFSYITYAYMLNLFNYSVCWQPVIYCCSFMPYQFALFEFFAYTTFNYNRFGIDEVSGSGPEFIEVLGFFVIVFLFNKFLTISESIGSKIAEGGINTSGMAQGVMSSVASMPKQFTNTMDRTARSAVNTYMNDPKAYQRMKSNMKTKAYDKTFGKLDEKLTGNLSQTKKNQARAIKQAVKSAHAERQELKANKSNLQQEQKAIESKLKEKETKLAKLIKENPGSKKAEKLKSEIENLQARKDQIPSQIAELQSKEANFNLEDKIRENIADSGAMRSDKDIDQVMQSSKLAQDIEDVNKRMEKEDKWKQDKQEGRDKFDQMTGRSNTTPSDEDGSVLGENQAEVSEEEQERGSVVSPDGDPPAGTSEEEQERDLEVSPDGDPPAGTSEVDQRSSITEDSDDEEKEK